MSNYAKKVEKFEVFEITYALKTGAEKIVIEKPNSETETLSFFYHVPISFVYDVHGYEDMETVGSPELKARFCPQLIGEHKFSIYSGDQVLESGSFICEDSENHGYIKVSDTDRRYFEYTDGTPYIPIGINMVYPTSYLRSDGTEFGQTTISDTMGIKCYEKWIKDFAKAGGNYLRLWLGHDYFNTTGNINGVIKYEQFAKTDAIILLAKKYGIKLKFTIEQFRHIGEKKDLFTRKFVTSGGRVCQSAEEWLTNDTWQDAWKGRVKEYLIRYSNEPTVAVWELWNEMLCFDSSVEEITKWTANAINFIKENAPNQLVTTSFGSLNPRCTEKWYKAHFLKELDFLQVHRYLDQGEKQEFRRTDPYVNMSHSIHEISTNDKPSILAETGAVNNNHSGPFRYYLSDDRGIIFADTVYPAFFAGSAGCGQIWHWDDRYVSAKSLYKMFAPFAELVKEINPVTEGFTSIDLSNDQVFCTILKGKNTILGYVRNRSDSWYNTLRDLNKPEIIENISISFESFDNWNSSIIKIWEDDTTKLEIENNNIIFKNLKYGTFFKIEKI